MSTFQRNLATMHIHDLHDVISTEI